MKYGLSEEQLQETIAFIRKYPEVERAVLFGSRAIGAFKEASDVDIALFGAQVTAGLAAKIKFEIEEDTYLPFFFDFIAYPSITNEALREHIDTKGVVLFGGKGAGDLREGWRECKLKNAPLSIIDGDRGVNYPSQNEIFDNGYCLFMNTKNVREDGFSFSECNFISKEKDQLLRKGKLNRNDLVLTTRGTVGNLGFYNDKVTFDNIRINSGMVIIRPDIEKLLPAFNYYLFRKLQADFSVFVSGSAQPQLPIKDLNEMEILLPPVSEQTAIASVLSSLDDKIDLLHRQNKTLENLAEALFRQWFVEEADEGWEEGNIFQLIDLVGGGTPKTEEAAYWDGDIPWLSGGDIASNHKLIILDSEKHITADGLAHSSTKLLPKYSTVISARGTVGKHCILGEMMAFSQSNYGILPKADNCYFFTHLLINYAVGELKSSAYGSVFDTITTETFRQISLSIPSDDEIKWFNNSVLPYFNKIEYNQRQIFTLVKIRDTLLPKLIGGEVEVGVQNRLIDEAFTEL